MTPIPRTPPMALTAAPRALLFRYVATVLFLAMVAPDAAWAS